MSIKWDKYAKGRLLERNRLIFEHHQEAVREYIRFFSKVNVDSNVLDLACGGFFLEILRNLGFVNIQGIDLFSPFVVRAKNKNLNVQIGNILKINFDEAYDYIICMEIFEHLEFSPTDQIYKALKKGCILYVTVPVYDSFWHKAHRINWKTRKIQQAKEHDPTHIRAYSKRILINEIIRNGKFKCVYKKHCHNLIPFIKCRSLMKLLGRIINQGMFFVAAFQKQPIK